MNLSKDNTIYFWLTQHGRHYQLDHMVNDVKNEPRDAKVANSCLYMRYFGHFMLMLANCVISIRSANHSVLKTLDECSFD